MSDETLDPMWLAFSQLPIVDTRSPEQKARFEAGLAEIRERRYERPARRPR